MKEEIIDCSKGALDKLVDSYLHEIKVENFTKNDLNKFFVLIGFSNELSEEIAEYAFASWNDY